MFRTLLMITILFGTTAAIAADDVAPYEGSTFKEVRDQVLSDPYTKLPMTEVKLSTFFKRINLKIKSLIFGDAVRTLSDRSDLLPSWNKLVHPIGTCLVGTWAITEDTKYTGYYKKGAEGLIILRASEAMGHPSLGDYRAFGLAGKLFPSMDEAAKVETANFFTVDDLGGTKISDFTRTELTNKPALTLRFSDLNLLAIGAATAKAFNKADKLISKVKKGDAGIRPLYPISEMGLAEGETAVTPTFMRLSGTKETVRTNENKDFRDDLKLDNFKSGLAFDIALRDKETDQWTVVGQIKINQSVASESCDHQLHFSHPTLR